VAKAYLTKENFSDRWEDAKTYMAPIFEPLAEYERIARNRPHPGINKAYPKNTDGTLAAIIQEQPKRTIQQIPTGKVKTDGDPIKSIVANFVLTQRIIPNAISQADVLQKSWGIMSKALTFGSYGSMTFFGKHNDYTGADFKLFYIKDAFFERGKLTFADCNIFFVRSWYQPSDIDALIERHKDNEFSKWNVKKLEELKDQIKKKEQEAQSSGEKERNRAVEAIELVTGFQDGIKAKFYVFAPDLGDGPDGIVGEFENEDPRGVMPIQWLYANIDFENPLGRGVVELSGGTQNVIDSMLQSYQYMRALQLAPPMVKTGSWNKTQAKLQPNALIDLGTDPSNSLTPLKLDTTALTNFSGDYGLFKSQIIALNNNGDTSISSEVGNPGFSKTSAGVESQNLKLGVSDNYMRKQFEAWFGDVSESMLNIEFANKHGKEELQLDKDTADKIREINPELVTDDDKFVIDYDEYQDTLKFTVDASTSDKASTQAQLESLDSLLQRIEGSPLLSGLLQQYPDKAVELFNRFASLTGVEDQEKLAIDMDQFKADQEEAEAMAQQQAQAQAMQPQLPAELPLDPSMIPEGEVMQQPVDPMVEQLPPELMEAPQAGLEQLAGPIEAPIEESFAQPIDQPMQEEFAQLPDPLEDGVINEDDLIGFTDFEIEAIQDMQERNIDNEIIAQAIVMIREDVPLEDVAEIVGQLERNI